MSEIDMKKGFYPSPDAESTGGSACPHRAKILLPAPPHSVVEALNMRSI